MSVIITRKLSPTLTQKLRSLLSGKTQKSLIAAARYYKKSDLVEAIEVLVETSWKTAGTIRRADRSGSSWTGYTSEGDVVVRNCYNKSDTAKAVVVVFIRDL